MLESYRDLIAWQRAVEMALSIYRVSATFPKEELYGLTSQLRRAGVSVASNIAEGYGRRSRGEYKQFLGIARGSNFEVQIQLVIATGLNYGSPELLTKPESLSLEVEKMLNTLISKL